MIATERLNDIERYKLGLVGSWVAQLGFLVLGIFMYSVSNFASGIAFGCLITTLYIDWQDYKKFRKVKGGKEQ